MLTAIAVQNYRSLSNLVIPLGGLNLITGSNGSGKSNIYKSLRLLAETAQAIASESLPKRLSSDNDPLFQYHQWKANIRILKVEELKTVPYVPMSHPFVERLIGTVRREYLDQVFFWSAADLERKLGEFSLYFNQERTHSGLRGDTPSNRSGNRDSAIASQGDYRWQKRPGAL